MTTEEIDQLEINALALSQFAEIVLKGVKNLRIHLSLPERTPQKSKKKPKKLDPVSQAELNLKAGIRAKHFKQKIKAS